jgi:hypothetical protein
MEPLDYPRQSLYNLVGGAMDGDLARMVPGLAGLAAFVPATLAAGPGAGMLAASLVGGAGQGLGLALDEERFTAPGTEDLVEALGGDRESFLQNMLAGAITDPTTYAGSISGALKGARMGDDYGKFLGQAALDRSLGYQGGAEKLWEGAERIPSDTALRLASIERSPHSADVLGELPPGSTYLGGGAQADVWRVPSEHGGGVVRIEGGPGSIGISEGHTIYRHEDSLPPPPRLSHPDIVQPVRSIATGPYRIERLPELEIPPALRALYDDYQLASLQRPSPTQMDAARASLLLENSLGQAGINTVDLSEAGIHRGQGQLPNLPNLGRAPSGSWLVSDPGSAHLPGGAVPPEPIASAKTGPVGNLLLRWLRSSEDVQREVAEALGRGIPPDAGVRVAGNEPIPPNLQAALQGPVHDPSQFPYVSSSAPTPNGIDIDDALAAPIEFDIPQDLGLPRPRSHFTESAVESPGGFRSEVSVDELPFAEAHAPGGRIDWRAHVDIPIEDDVIRGEMEEAMDQLLERQINISRSRLLNPLNFSPDNIRGQAAMETEIFNFASGRLAQMAREEMEGLPFRAFDDPTSRARFLERIENRIARAEEALRLPDPDIMMERARHMDDLGLLEEQEGVLPAGRGLEMLLAPGTDLMGQGARLATRQLQDLPAQTNALVDAIRGVPEDEAQAMLARWLMQQHGGIE